MKKSYIFVIIFLILLLTAGCIFYFTNKNKAILYFEGKTINEVRKIYQIDDKNAIYTNYKEVYYVKKDETKVELGMALKDNLITIDEIIKKSSYSDTVMDGGSIVAKSNNKKDKLSNITFDTIKCHKMIPDYTQQNPVQEYIEDIYIGDFNIDNVCKR